MRKENRNPHISLTLRNNVFRLSYHEPHLAIDACVNAALDADGDLPNEIRNVVLNLFVTLCLNDESYMLDAISWYGKLRVEQNEEEE